MTQNNQIVGRREFLAAGLAFPMGMGAVSSTFAAGKTDSEPLTVVVMDPLSAPLACDCVQGYAQRKYEKLAGYLQKKVGVPVKIVWSDSLQLAMKEKTAGKADLVIGKHSVVLSDAKKVGMKVEPVAQLTDTKGKTTQTGLVVVRQLDPAFTVADIKGYRIFFGPADCDEKYAAPMALLKKFEVTPPANPEISSACSTAATKLLELDPKIPAAAIISSYAEPLLEGCGTIKKGDLRVIGESQPVPFVTAFLKSDLSAERKKAVTQALLLAGTEPELLIALETKSGFVSFQKTPGKKKG